MTGNAELQTVREEIRRADEALVRDLVALGAGAGEPWEAQASARPAFRARVALGVKVAESKFRHNPGRFRPLAAKRDEKGLEQAITDPATEGAVLDRVRRQTLECGGDPAVAERVAALYLNRVIPETKRIQIRRLCEMA
jgi:chorismate mutase